ncbi:hypothetical protein [Lysinibacillus sp. OF-1]|uniref:hypothetical protein n=1 Tax=Lysinibacillus sp. OF-1 TaxID=2972483 RepID=UPI00232AB9EF|nr:hypothetical protein [Lysinibacillus sp. OF-1]WCH48145.1 hypothetical protein NV349_01805 [Lysinibacillus sp. OF-1]
MQNVIIDPYTLIFNPLYNSKTEMLNYIDRILDADEIKNYNFIKALISDNTANLLMSQNNFPEWDVLNTELKKFDLHGQYQAQDIFRALEGILNLDTIERHTNVQDILYTPLSALTSEVKNAADEYLIELERLYVYCVLNSRIHGSTILKSINTCEVEVCSEILEFTPPQQDIELPFTFTEILNTIDTLQEILLSIDCIDLWKNSTTEDQFTEIIKLYLIQENANCRNNFEIGSSFIENFKKYGFFQENSKIKGVLKSITEVLTGSTLNKVHALRINEAGNSPQIEGNLGKAWRHDIDKEFHLHYWKKGNTITFASIGPHNTFSIPE